MMQLHERVVLVTCINVGTNVGTRCYRLRTFASCIPVSNDCEVRRDRKKRLGFSSERAASGLEAPLSNDCENFKPNGLRAPSWPAPTSTSNERERVPDDD